MQVDDIPLVMEIEEASFATPWPARGFKQELTTNEFAHCYVLERAASSATGLELVGYGCYWQVVDESHISTLAVAPAWRGHGLGELLLHLLIDESIRSGMLVVTLEVRISNCSAQALYSKYGLQVVGRRKRYYCDNGEDAWIMTSEPLDKAYQRRLLALREPLFDRLAGQG